MRRNYDGYTAVTFLMIGLGAGALLALLLAPHPLEGLQRTADAYRLQPKDRMSA